MFFLRALKFGRSHYVETRLRIDNEFVDLSVPGHYGVYSISRIFFLLLLARSLRRAVDGGCESVQEQINVC